MAVPPTLETARLRLVPFEERHMTERYLAWLNNRELMRYSEQRHRTHTMETCRAYWQSFAGTPHYFWAIEEVADGLGHIGNLNVYLDVHNGLADLGLLVGEQAAQGKGLGLEAWETVIAFLFQQAKVRKITAGTMAANMPMLRIMERSGMVADGLRKRHYVAAGQEMDVVYRALFREQWLSMRGGQDDRT